MNNTSSDWPEAYRHWTGTFSELVATAGRILAQLDPSIRPPTARVLRYYQSQGVLGRGQRQGNRSVFDFNDLERVVATKGLVKQNWTLDNATRLFEQSSPQEPAVSELLYQAAGASPAPLGAVALNAAAPPDASAVVARLLGKSAAFLPNTSFTARGLPPAHTAAAPGLSGAVTAYASVPVQALRPAPWLTVYIDQAAAQVAGPAERAQARQALENLLYTLR